MILFFGISICIIVISCRPAAPQSWFQLYHCHHGARIFVINNCNILIIISHSYRGNGSNDSVVFVIFFSLSFFTTLFNFTIISKVLLLLFFVCVCFVLLILSLFISSLFCFLVSGVRASYCRFLSCFLTCPSFFMFFLVPNVCVTGCGTGPPCINVCIHLLYLVYSHTYIFEMYAYIHEYGCGAHVYTYNMYAYIHSCISPQHSVQHRFTAIRNGSHVFQIEF